MTGRPARPAIEKRLSAAGLPPLARLAWLEIDLDRLRGNLDAFRAAVPAEARVEPVLKADAYGHGALPIGRALEAAGVDRFSVATFDEAVELREGGIRASILCLFAVPPAVVPEAMRRSIAVAASDESVLDRMLASAAAAWARGARPALDVHLDVETGLGRAGIDPERTAAAARRIAAASGASLAGLWSHVQAATDRPRTAGQVARFADALRYLAEDAGFVPERHFAASAGIITGVVPAYDGIRIGLSMFGIVPDEVGPDDVAGPPGSLLRPILSLHARPIRVAAVPTGAGISYGPSFTTSRPSRIATLPLGYGDGLPRLLSNRAQALVRGQRVPLVGNVAMDAVMADVTDVNGTPVSIDDEFVLLGEQGGSEIPIDELARRRTTNTYETVTSMSRRLARVYHAGSIAVAIRTLRTE